MTAAYEHGGQYPGNGAAPSGQPTETEIGNIIIEAQRFADATAVEARRAADAIVAQAGPRPTASCRRPNVRRWRQPPMLFPRSRLPPCPSWWRPSMALPGPTAL